MTLEELRALRVVLRQRLNEMGDRKDSEACDDIEEQLGECDLLIARAERDHARRAITDLEWAGRSHAGPDACPVCHGWKIYGHVRGCILAAAIASAGTPPPIGGA